MNNLPSVILVNITISSIHLKSLVFLNVLANDIGTKMTPIGSLATLLWLNILRGKGERIDIARFMKTGVIVTIPVLIAGISVLWLILAM
jgi:arsenical pump membrane protein